MEINHRFRGCVSYYILIKLRRYDFEINREKPGNTRLIIIGIQ
uniref:Uncharacterized protein n=1 Tax=Microviridae sp. cttoc6 TaxID=2825009 RepID=A0A8S5TVD3_9VIRU|nr:MAG TPA: hypothetical protein [Microviridae sp. cttoc6]